MKYIFLMLTLGLFLGSCKKKAAVDQGPIDEKIITDYIAAKNLSATATGTGLYYTIDVVGPGIKPNATSTVKVAYKGYFTDGNVFDQSPAAGVNFNLQNVIKGWTEGIPYFKKGGSGKLLIPSALAYGTKGTQGIPPNSVLIFDINLIDVY